MTYDDPEIRRRFEEWKAKAQEVDILGEAQSRGAKLRRAGSEWIGPCPACGGKDRFGVNVIKRVAVCRGAGGGDVIWVAMHLSGIDFLTACEQLAGEPPPRGKGKELSAEEKAERDRRRAQSAVKAEEQRLEAEMDEAERLAAAAAIWRGIRPIAGTLGEVYLGSRGFEPPPGGWPDCVGFHPSLPYPGLGRHPAVVCRVDDVAGDLTAVWRIFIRADGRGKADVPDAKLGLGPSAGGAVRIGGVGSKTGAAEGFESALGAWYLTGWKYPVWACLSTSGLEAVEFPLDVERCVVFPDGDLSMKRQNGVYVPVAVPPGRKAARALKARLATIGMPCVIAAEPPAKVDYCDLWNSHKADVARAAESGIAGAA